MDVLDVLTLHQSLRNAVLNRDHQNVGDGHGQRREADRLRPENAREQDEDDEDCCLARPGFYPGP